MHRRILGLGAALATAVVLSGCEGSFGGGPGISNPGGSNGSKLAFTQQPTTASPTTVIIPAVKVAVQDGSGTLVSGDTSVISITLGSNPSGAVLSGTTNVSAVGGVATFSDLSLDLPGTGYTLVASASGLTSATSVAFNVGVSTGVPGSISVQVGDIFFLSPRNGTQNPAIDSVSVAAGGGTASVTWNWIGDLTHGIESLGSPSFTSSVLMTGAGNSYNFGFTTAGTYQYDCGFHGLAMTGTIVVQP